MASPTKPVAGYALRLRGIRVGGHVGVSIAERELLQELVVGADVEFRGERFPATDELTLAADYSAIVSAADELTRERAFLLLETMALSLARRLEALWSDADRIRVAITKARVPVSPQTDEATVEIVLGREVA